MTGSGGALGTVRYFIRQESRRIDEMFRRHRRRIERKLRRVGTDNNAFDERLDDVEGDLGSLLLLAMTINRLLVRKQILTTGEIVAEARKIDLADGVADGKLDPSAVRPPEAKRTADMQPEEFLRNLERDQQS